MTAIFAIGPAGAIVGLVAGLIVGGRGKKLPPFADKAHGERP
jgi:hypothetical protein